MQIPTTPKSFPSKIITITMPIPSCDSNHSTHKLPQFPYKTFILFGLQWEFLLLKISFCSYSNNISSIKKLASYWLNFTWLINISTMNFFSTNAEHKDNKNPAKPPTLWTIKFPLSRPGTQLMNNALLWPAHLQDWKDQFLQIKPQKRLGSIWHVYIYIYPMLWGSFLIF